jgi:hypothetical protein
VVGHRFELIGTRGMATYPATPFCGARSNLSANDE